MQPTTRPRIHSSLATAIGGSLVVALVAACAGDSTGASGNVPAQLSFAATTSAGAAGDLAPAAAITAGTHTLDLTNIGLTITRAELKTARTNVCSDDDNDDAADDRHEDHPRGGGNHDGCGELKVGPTTLDIAVNGNAATIPTNSIPAGTYRELELRLSQVEIKGTFDGTAFDVTVPFSTRAEIEFDPPLVVSDTSPANVTVNLPLATWFTNPNGTLVDPNQLNTNPTLLAQVKARILQSLRAIEDRNHDGRDDHGRDRHGGNSGPG